VEQPINKYTKAANIFTTKQIRKISQIRGGRNLSTTDEARKQGTVRWSSAEHSGIICSFTFNQPFYIKKALFCFNNHIVVKKKVKFR